MSDYGYGHSGADIDCSIIFVRRRLISSTDRVVTVPPTIIHFNSVSVVYKMDVPSFLCLETSPAIKYLLLKKRKFHMNDIFVDREKYGESHTLFHQLFE